ncbi:MAG: hypothetical protein AB1439_05280 [candidate division FCPU426 bacterium]
MLVSPNVTAHRVCGRIWQLIIEIKMNKRFISARLICKITSYLVYQNIFNGTNNSILRALNKIIILKGFPGGSQGWFFAIFSVAIK